MRIFRLLILFVTVLSGTALGVSPSTYAGESKKPSLEERLEALDQKQRILERQLELEREKADAKAKETPSLSFGEDGFVLRSADGDSKLRVGGYLHADGRFYIDDETKPATDTLLLRRVRPLFEGALFKYFDFKLMPDFGDGKTAIFDAYFGVNYLPEAKLRIGKFKTPFGLEQLQSARTLEFVERALPSALVPNRDIGVQLHGDLWGGVLGYAVGVFNGVPDGASGDSDANDSKDFAGRVFAHPFKQSGIEPLAGLGVGVAGTYGRQEGSVASPTLPSFKTSSQRTFFSYRSDGTTGGTAVANGNRSRFSPQTYYYWGPFGLIGEYILSAQEVVKNGSLTRLENKAWQVAASYVLTGESASYKGVKPKRPFDPQKGGWGAFELTGRYHELEVDKNAFPIYADATKSANEARAWTLGVNWYLNSNAKFNLNYENTNFKGGETNGDRENDHAVLSRFQIVF